MNAFRRFLLLPWLIDLFFVGWPPPMTSPGRVCRQGSPPTIPPTLREAAVGARVAIGSTTAACARGWLEFVEGVAFAKSRYR